MIAVDTNILVHAHRADSHWHELSLERLMRLSESGRPWSVPWPCVHEFIAVVTHPIMRPASKIAVAFDAIEAWLSQDSVHLIGEGSEHLAILRRVGLAGRVQGGMIHNAKIAAICLAHGVSELWSADRDFSRFPDLKVVNPLVSM